MIETNGFVESRVGALRVYGPSARAAPTDRLGAFAVALRATCEMIGLFSLVVVIVLAVAPGLRGPSAQLLGRVWAEVSGASSQDAAEDDTDTAEAEGPRIGQPVVLGRADSNVATYLAHRYHVADDAVRVMVATARTSGTEHQVDPLLILAVVAVESSMNPFAQSRVGATGLMQVMPALHGSKFQDRDAEVGPLDPVANIRVGSQILGDVIRRGGSIERGLQLYVGAGNLADDGGYSSRVLAELGRLRLASAGGVAEALAAGLRADTHAAAGGEPLTSVFPPEEHRPMARKQHDA